jgi:CBS domain-containing protein
MTGTMTNALSLERVAEIAAELGVEAKVDIDQLRMGMEVELEHGRRDPLTNVTDDDPLLTAKIALAHLNELPDYYTRLRAMESHEAATVGDLMTSPPITVSEEAPMSLADRLLREHNVSGLAVVNAAGTLVGVVSRTDILRLASDSAISVWPGLRVSRAMTSPAVTIGPDGTLQEAAAILEAHHVHRLVVVDADQRAIGIFSTTDLVRAVGAPHSVV